MNSFVGSFTSAYRDPTMHVGEVMWRSSLENTTIENVGQRIEDSLIGRNVASYGSNRLPRSYRLVPGGFSEISVP